MPSAFISYSWEDDDHKRWVRELAARLRTDGIETVLDQWDAAPGDQLPAFMERAIRSNDYVLIMCTPRYKLRCDERKGGVGYEGDIMTAEVITTANHRKFIPILRRGHWPQAAPTWLAGKYFIDLSANPYAEDGYSDLVVTLHGKRAAAPPVGKPFTTVPQPGRETITPRSEPEADIRILGVIADEVTTPRMDGTEGSALYRVPFRLSRRPDTEWARLFVENWNNPPRYTSIHRPRIASVTTDTIVLDGTTLDEVAQYHRDTLKLVLSETNRQLAERQREREAAEARRRAIAEEHHRNVETKAKEIKFE